MSQSHVGDFRTRWVVSKTSLRVEKSAVVAPDANVYHLPNKSVSPNSICNTRSR